MADPNNTHDDETEAYEAEAALATVKDRALQVKLRGLQTAIGDTPAGAARSAVENLANAAQMLLPHFDSDHALPNAVLRSALFPALNYRDGKRSYLRDEPIYATGDLRITFTGEQFDQTDLDVLLAIFDIGSAHKPGIEFRFSEHALLRRLKRSAGGHDRGWLIRVIARLRGGTLILKQGRRKAIDGLLSAAAVDEETGEWVVCVNAKWCELFGFGVGTWSRVNREERAALGRNGTAKLLHGYYSSHAAPSAHNIETLARIAGLKPQRAAKQRETIIRAHDALADSKCGFLKGYTVTKTMICVEKATHTASQERHLNRRAAVRRRADLYGEIGQTSAGKQYPS